MTTLLLWSHGCGGEAFIASEDGGGSGGATGSSVGSGGTGGFADVAVGSGGQRDAGGAGGVVSDGTVALDAGSPCGLAMGSASHTSGSNLAQLAVSHTVLGSNRLLVVAVAIRHDNGMPNTIPSPLAVSYGAAALTRLKLATDNYYQAAELWSLVAPPPGVDQVTVKFTSAPQQTALGVMSFTGAAQSATFGAVAAIAGGGTSATLSVPSTGYTAVVDLLSHGGIQEWTAAAGEQELWRDGTTGVHGYSSFTRVVGTATGRSWNGPAAANYVLLGVPIAEVHCM